MTKRSEILSAALLAFAVAVVCITLGSLTSCVAPQVAPEPVASLVAQDYSTTSCGQYQWKDRGRAPSGYINGMAQAFRINLCRYRSPEATVAGLIAGGGGEEALIKAWTLGIGLGMRESSGKYCEGRDMSATNVKADTAEAGPFQASYNSRGVAVDRLNGLWAWYRAHEDQCGLETWRVGVNTSHKSCQPAPAGQGPGRDWQEFTRSCPNFAAEWAMVIAKRLPAHFGPLVRKEAEYRPECEAMLRAIAKETVCE